MHLNKTFNNNVKNNKMKQWKISPNITKMKEWKISKKITKYNIEK